MRKNQIKGLVHDLLNLRDWKSPLDRRMLRDKIEVNLLTNEILGTDDTELIEFFRQKIFWFQSRIKELKGIEEFQEAKIFISGNIEKVELTFKNELFAGEMVWGKELEDMKERFEMYGKEK